MNENNIELITKICVDCGQVFETYRETNITCEGCVIPRTRHEEGIEHTKVWLSKDRR